MVRRRTGRPRAASRLSYRFLYLRWNAADMKLFGTTTVGDGIYAMTDVVQG